MFFAPAASESFHVFALLPESLRYVPAGWLQNTSWFCTPQANCVTPEDGLMVILFILPSAFNVVTIGSVSVRYESNILYRVLRSRFVLPCCRPTCDRKPESTETMKPDRS